VPRPHRSPAQIHHQELEALGRFRGSLEPWNIELFKDGIRGYALHAVVTYLASDVSQGSGPVVWRCYSQAGDLQALDEGSSRYFGCGFTFHGAYALLRSHWPHYIMLL
jgi:hypothetical protein